MVLDGSQRIVHRNWKDVDYGLYGALLSTLASVAISCVKWHLIMKCRFCTWDSITFRIKICQNCTEWAKVMQRHVLEDTYSQFTSSSSCSRQSELRGGVRRNGQHCQNIACYTIKATPQFHVLPFMFTRYHVFFVTTPQKAWTWEVNPSSASSRRLQRGSRPSMLVSCLRYDSHFLSGDAGVSIATISCLTPTPMLTLAAFLSCRFCCCVEFIESCPALIV